MYKYREGVKNMGAKIITVTNQKGGTGKSSTAYALVLGLIRKGYRCLAIDLDPQGNLSFTLGADTSKKTVFGLFTQENTTDETIQKTKHCDIISSSKLLSGADTILKTTGGEYRLKEALEDIKSDYDFIIIDTPPSLSSLTVNALTTSTDVVIPVQADVYSIQGITQLWDTIQPIKKYCNPNLSISGILLTRYNNRAVLNREIEETFRNDIAKQVDSKVYNATIREGVAIREAQFTRQNLFEYAPTSKVTLDYETFINEFLEDMKQ